MAREVKPVDVLPTLPLRRRPGDDPRRAIEAAVIDHGIQAAFVLAGICSPRPALMRPAGADSLVTLDEDLELLTLSGCGCGCG